MPDWKSQIKTSFASMLKVVTLYHFCTLIIGGWNEKMEMWQKWSVTKLTVYTDYIGFCCMHIFILVWMRISSQQISLMLCLHVLMHSIRKSQQCVVHLSSIHIDWDPSFVQCISWCELHCSVLRIKKQSFSKAPVQLSRCHFQDATKCLMVYI